MAAMIAFLVTAAWLLAPDAAAREPAPTGEAVRAEHAAIGLGPGADEQIVHSTHPGAQWFPEAGLGLFIHWGISSVRAMNISWPMIDRGQGAQITANDYWAMAKDFQPRKYDPGKWLKAARAAGFKYAVFTTRHHEGYAMWPSAFGELGTRTLMGGRDLVKDFVNAARQNGLKVGFYYSPPDWYFDREYMNFTRRKDSPPIGPDGKPRTAEKPPAEAAAHRQAYAAMVKGQLEELLTRYGKIDLMWFDGRPRGLTGDECMPLERIRQLQPGIVVNPRLHRRGDFKTYERVLKTDKVATTWAEFCNTWTDYWPHVAGKSPQTSEPSGSARFRDPGFVLGQYVTARAWRINYLLGVGPTADGELAPEAYANMKTVGDWLKRHRRSLEGIQPLPASESASVPATASKQTRYLFALPTFKAPAEAGKEGRFPADRLPPTDTTITLRGVSRPRRVRLLGGDTLPHQFADGVLTIPLPASKRTALPDVVQVDLTPGR
jgi:alpha-L-fucosidase